MHCGEAMKAVFGSGELAREEAVCSSLASYIGDLEKETGMGWLYRFFV